MKVRKLGTHIGARIEGIDFSRNLTSETIGAITEALFEHQVVSLPAPEMRPEQQLEIARAFGVPEKNATDQFVTPHEVPEITVIDSAAGDRADSWHTDESFLEHSPLVNLLYGEIIPETGGDTAFVSAADAYDGLSAKFQELLGDLVAVHDYGHLYELGWQAGIPLGPAVGDALAKGLMHTHPVVRKHRITGRRWLAVNATYTRFIQGVGPLEAQMLLDLLLRHMQKPEFAFRHRWQPGDLLLWDQQAVQHYAVNDASGRRVVHRIAVLESDETYKGVRSA
ncbi:MAG: TauD/TfdA family dioxygenase [Myxococcota bacterium]|jgi:taurine dioxygenase|nr:TauD/TfdA family dioxygenase [Myxococcota bacterium]